MRKWAIISNNDVSIQQLLALHTAFGSNWLTAGANNNLRICCVVIQLFPYCGLSHFMYYADYFAKTFHMSKYP